MKVSGRGRSATQRGLTLVELLVVMAVLGILAWAATPMVELSVQRQREQELKRALWEIRDALDAYHLAAQQGLVAGGASGYPPSLEALVQGVPDVKAPGQMRYFLRRIPSDPFAPPAHLRRCHGACVRMTPRPTGRAQALMCTTFTAALTAWV
ncbi:type II secretion system protein [Ideonella paludis]|uniref:type II secretion system protein n=1 Tax=Ideonella paludis TaxID=1233411 RepID=UPI003636DD2A